MNIIDIVKGTVAHIHYYRQGVVYYRTTLRDEASLEENANGVDYIFPVPLDDVGDATLNWEEKCIFLMRYIRKAINEGTFVRRKGS